MFFKQFKTLFIISLFSFPTTALAGWPVAVVDEVAVHPAQSSIRIDPLENDIGEDLEIKSVNEWSENGARITIVEDHLSYTPPENYTGEDGFWYVITDAQGRTNAIRVSVDIKPNLPGLPIPQDDLISTPKNTAIRINVLKNDLFNTTTLTGQATANGIITKFDELSQNGGNIEKVIVYPESHETFRYQLRYTPPPSFSGTDSFSYSVKDFESNLTGTSEKTARVTIEVSENTEIQGPLPVATPDSSIVSCDEATCVDSKYPVLRNDTGKNLILKLANAWSEKGNSVFLSPLKAGALLDYTVKPDFIGTEDKVTYLIEDQYGRRSWGELTIKLTREPEVEEPETTSRIGVSNVAGSVFERVDLHRDILKGANFVPDVEWDTSIWAGGTGLAEANVLSGGIEGSSQLQLANTKGFGADQLITYEGNDGQYYTSVIKNINGTTAVLEPPIEVTMSAPAKIKNFYIGPNHPNENGYKAIADYASRHLLNLNEGKHVLLGDSWFDHHPRHFSNRLASRLPNATIINSGVGGSTTQDLLDRFDTSVTNQNPDIVWIMVGTNDYQQSVSKEAYSTNIQKLVRKINDINARAIVFNSSVGALMVYRPDGTKYEPSPSDRLEVLSHGYFNEIEGMLTN